MPARIPQGLLPRHQEERPQAQDAVYSCQSVDGARALCLQHIIEGISATKRGNDQKISPPTLRTLAKQEFKGQRSKKLEPNHPRIISLMRMRLVASSMGGLIRVSSILDKLQRLCSQASGHDASLKWHASISLSLLANWQFP